MVDHHGNRIVMKNGVEMELADGRLVEMKNKVIWITYGPPNKGGVIRKTERLSWGDLQAGRGGCLDRIG